jgi:acyl-CoA thioesterase FadM
MLTFTLRAILQMAAGTMLGAKPGKQALSVSFRLWPVDMDIYGHMNNACYIRVAELSRWRQSAESGLLMASVRKGWMFLIAEQSIVYTKPIMPLSQYTVRSNITTDGKW